MIEVKYKKETRLATISYRGTTLKRLHNLDELPNVILRATDLTGVYGFFTLEPNWDEDRHLTRGNPEFRREVAYVADVFTEFLTALKEEPSFGPTRVENLIAHVENAVSEQYFDCGQGMRCTLSNGQHLLEFQYRGLRLQTDSNLTDVALEHVAAEGKLQLPVMVIFNGGNYCGLISYTVGSTPHKSDDSHQVIPVKGIFQDEEQLVRDIETAVTKQLQLVKGQLTIRLVTFDGLPAVPVDTVECV